MELGSIRPRPSGNADASILAEIRISTIPRCGAGVAYIPASGLRAPAPSSPAFHLLVDSASALYLWDCLTEAMAEFGGVVLRDEDMPVPSK